MKITAIETLRTEEFSNVLWVRLHTDHGSIGLGETFYGAAAVEAAFQDLDAAGIAIDILVNNAGIQHRQPMWWTCRLPTGSG
ncbi:hypothetical protein [Paracoccus subflavus]|uniref:hypothetical protein n=1 Tax=Paracoccus subflavus TaxID=2528244 RepID=UPI001FE27A7C|nr:hypothetical protein [Paracoccus subflavus]